MDIETANVQELKDEIIRLRKLNTKTTRTMIVLDDIRMRIAFMSDACPEHLDDYMWQNLQTICKNIGDFYGLESMNVETSEVKYGSC